MIKFFSAVKRFVRDDRGITAIEYGLIAALMAAAVIAGVLVLAPSITEVFIELGNKIVMPP